VKIAEIFVLQCYLVPPVILTFLRPNILIGVQSSNTTTLSPPPSNCFMNHKGIQDVMEGLDKKSRRLHTLTECDRICRIHFMQRDVMHVL
jgi:hypothetical protein